MTSEGFGTSHPPGPQWIASTLHRTPGRDPLALQTITQDRIIPLLLPGILALSRRARYFSFYCFLLDEFARRRMSPTNAVLSKFILAKEYELALAIEMCPRNCGSSPIGRNRTGPAIAQNPSSFGRGESVETPLGGYGLYYRSPLVELGLVARMGTPLGDIPTPIDVLVPEELGIEAADAFRSAIKATQYFKKHFAGISSIPRDILENYAESACLCRLDEHLEERKLIQEAIFIPRSDAVAAAAKQRRESFALFLGAVDLDSAASLDPAAFREQVWQSFLARQKLSDSRSRPTAQWAGLVLKEYMQDSLSVIWEEFCREGLRHQPRNGYTAAELTEFLRAILAAPRVSEMGRNTIAFEPGTPTKELVSRIAAASSTLSLEDLRDWAINEESALAGLAFLIAVCGRLPGRESFSETDKAFLEIGVQRSMRQLGLLQIAQAFEHHQTTGPTVADTLAWAVRRFVIDVHERVAYSKLPNFTFRFRWEEGRLRFYDLGIWQFDLADSRHAAMSQISFDLGFLQPTEEGGQLTDDGTRFVAEAFK